MDNYNFSLLFLNVRRIRDFKKRNTMFTWINNKKADIFLQETYSTPEIVNYWKLQWKGDMYFSHGSNHSKGVLILIRDNMDFKLNTTKMVATFSYRLLFKIRLFCL
jgi:exonuclease III